METTNLDSKLGQRQTLAGTVVDGVRQPELKTDERIAIITADNPPVANAATMSALARQGRAGIAGEPELSTEERQLIADFNRAIPTRH